MEGKCQVFVFFSFDRPGYLVPFQGWRFHAEQEKCDYLCEIVVAEREVLQFGEEEQATWHMARPSVTNRCMHLYTHFKTRIDREKRYMSIYTSIHTYTYKPDKLSS